MSLNVPAPVAGYLAAEKMKDAERLARCFADDGVVHDEGGEHRGIDAIRAWKQEADQKYQFVVEPLDASTQGNDVSVRSRVSGTFPGSPITLDFRFTVAGEQIRRLAIS